MNIAHYLVENAEKFPARRAVVYPESYDRRGRAAYTHLTFEQLNAETDRFAAGLTAIGIKPGMSSLLMVRPGLDFLALTFALFKIGAVPVLIDPGMGWPSFLRCVKQVAPEALLGIRLAHILRLLRPRYFRSVRFPVTLGRALPGTGADTDSLPPVEAPFPMYNAADTELAAVLFTTGSTGPAKGVEYSHGIFNAQVEILRREYRITADDIDLPCFPLFALFSVALGATAVVPDMDPTRPATVDPMRIIAPIQDQGVTYSFGSPALWRTVGEYCVKAKITLPSVQRVLMAGAPVPAALHERMLHHVLTPGAEVHTPYGATEALPIASFDGSEMLADTKELTRCGSGICVGRPIQEVSVRIIRTIDDVIDVWDDALMVPDGEVGEITVRGPVVTQQYHRLPEHTRLAKIRDGGEVWHRMGDMGYIDGGGRIWFCGRKSHRVIVGSTTCYTVCCEAIFNEHPAVFRSALVGVGADRYNQTPVLIVEPESGQFPAKAGDRKRLTDELLAMGARSELTRMIRHVLFHPAFPVDIRHNAKIRREQLADWATQRLIQAKRAD